MTRRPAAVLFVGDLHVGSTVALAPKAHIRNTTQAQIGAAWADLTKRTTALAKTHSLYLALGGDLVEGFHHGSTESWAQDEDEQRSAAIDFLTPLAARADKLLAVLGTEAHAGRRGQDDRLIARELGATILEPGQDVEIGGRWLDWQHHGGRLGGLPWTREDGMRTLARRAWYCAKETGQPAPAIIMRHHVHQMPLPAHYRGTWAAICGCWQGVTTYGARQGYKATDIGAWVWYPADNRLQDWRWRVEVEKLRL